MGIEETLIDIAELYMDDYVWDKMRKGKKNIGCGCNSCYVVARDYYELFYWDASQIVDYDNLPDWLFITELRHGYRDGTYDPGENFLS